MSNPITLAIVEEDSEEGSEENSKKTVKKTTLTLTPPMTTLPGNERKPGCITSIAATLCCCFFKPGLKYKEPPQAATAVARADEEGERSNSDEAPIARSRNCGAHAECDQQGVGEGGESDREEEIIAISHAEGDGEGTKGVVNAGEEQGILDMLANAADNAGGALTAFGTVAADTIRSIAFYERQGSSVDSDGEDGADPAADVGVGFRCSGLGSGGGS